MGDDSGICIYLNENAGESISFGDSKSFLRYNGIIYKIYRLYLSFNIYLKIGL